MSNITNYLAQLSAEELNRLRSIVKRTHFKYYPAHAITDEEADKFIFAMGEYMMEKDLQRAMDQYKIVDKKIITFANQHTEEATCSNLITSHPEK